MTPTLALPLFDDATVVVPAPGPGPGNWSGAASAVLEDGVFWLTYRVRRPLAEGRAPVPGHRARVGATSPKPGSDRVGPNVPIGRSP